MSKQILAFVIVAFVLAFPSIAHSQDPTTEPTRHAESTKKKTTKKKKATETQIAPTTDQLSTPNQQAAPAVESQSEPTDLSGTYSGTFVCDAAGLNGDTTLTINGNQFTTADGKSGRIVASTTGGYTAVALQMGDGETAPPVVVSLRGRKNGNKLTLTAVDAAHPCSFAPTRATASRRNREAITPSATGTNVSNPAEVGPSPADVAAPAKKARTGRRATTATKLPQANPSSLPAAPATVPQPPQDPIPSPSPSPTRMPTPNPNPSPSPSPSPMPSPSPSPGGSPSPSPTPSPMPSPSPNPSPSPRPNP